MLKRLVVSMVVALCMTTGAFAAGSNLKVGVIDVQKIMGQSKQLKAEKAKLEKEFKPKQQAIIAKQDQIKKKIEKFQRDASVMTTAQKETMQQEIMKEQQAFNAEGQAYQQALNTAQNQAMQRFLTKVKAEVDAYAKSGKFDLIIQQEGVPYVKNSLDVTPDIIKRLQK